MPTVADPPEPKLEIDAADIITIETTPQPTTMLEAQAPASLAVQTPGVRVELFFDRLTYF